MRLTTAPLLDALVFSRELVALHDAAYVGEIHLLSYCACLLYYASDKTADNWGYGFSATSNGSPFATTIDTAISVLSSRRVLRQRGQRLRCGELAEEWLEQIVRSELHATRMSFLSSATELLLLFPIGLLRAGLREEPGLIRARRENDKRSLLQDVDLVDLREEMAVVREVVGDHLTFGVSAATWIACLLDRARLWPAAIGGEDDS